VVIAVLVVLPLPDLASPSGTSAQPSGLRAYSNTTTLTLGSTPIQLSPYFWGSTVEGRAKILPNEANLIAATPASVLVWPGGSTGDEYNPFTNEIVNTNGKLVASPTSEAQFIQLCRAINCTAIFELPGETDNATFAASVVNYTVHTLGFQPAYWEIGNEPELWSHWGVPWSQWANITTTGPSPWQFAREVQAFMLALRAVDPSIRVLGITATGRVNGPYSNPVTDWVNATVAINGPNISGVAVHIYPAGSKNKPGPATLGEFYGVLNGPPGVPARVSSIRSGIAGTLADNWSSDPGLSVPVFITEIGSALAHRNFGPFASNFPGALSLAAQMIQGMTLNVSNIDLFGSVLNTNNSWFDLQGQERPDYEAYTQLFNHLGPIAYPVTLPGYNGTLYGIATVDPHDGNRTDLMVVNTNLTTSVTIAPQLPGYAASTPVEMWQWDGSEHTGATNHTVWFSPATATPVASNLAALPASETLVAQSVELFEWYPSNGTQVVLQTSHLPVDARWFAHIGQRLVTSNQTSLTLFLPHGSYAVNADAFNLPMGTKNARPVERDAAFPASPLVVGSSNEVVPVPYVQQWRMTFEVVPSPTDGYIAPPTTWVNASQPFTVTAVPSPGSAFVRWTGYTNGTSGHGGGSVNSTSPTITIDPNGAVVEKAHFVAGSNVTFEETGLATGTFWSVTADGRTISSDTPNVTFVLANGTHGFNVTNVSGYRAHPPAGSVRVTGVPVVDPIRFSAITPRGKNYTLAFTEAGLPAGTNWSVTAFHRWNDSTTPHITFLETNGTRGFNVTPVAGYRATPSAGSVVIDGSNVTVTIRFAQKTPAGENYPLNFTETGLPVGTQWSVTAYHLLKSSTGATISFSEKNGTRGFNVTAIEGYWPSPSAGSVTVSGGPVNVTIDFTARSPPGATYLVAFREVGLPEGTAWSVSVRDQPVSTSTSAVEFQEINGSYGYTVGVIPGFRLASPNSGFDVRGGPVTVPLTFRVNAYMVAWQEKGLWSGVAWNVTVNGISYAASGAEVTVPLPNGTWSYAVQSASDFVASPRISTVRVDSGPLVCNLTFERAAFPVSFVEHGLPSNVTWTVRFSDVNITEVADASDPGGPRMFSNDTYSFDVGDPSGYFPDPSHGNVTISGAPTTLVFSFFPSGPPPIPPLAYLGVRAITVAVVLGLAAWGGFQLFGRIAHSRRRSWVDV
jgi:hypothetical protein